MLDRRPQQPHPRYGLSTYDRELAHFAEMEETIRRERRKDRWRAIRRLLSGGSGS